MAVHGGGIVDDEKDLQQFAQADLGRIELHPHHLGMTGVAAADLLVCGPGHLAVAVARLHRQHALHLLEHRFGAPEAAAAKDELG